MDINNAYHLIAQKLEGWLHDLIRLLPNILLAAIVLVIGIFIAGWIRKLAAKIIAKISHNTTLNGLFASVVYIFFVGISIFTALSIL